MDFEYLDDFNEILSDVRTLAQDALFESLEEYRAKYPDVPIGDYDAYWSIRLPPVRWSSSSGNCGWISSTELAPDRDTRDEAKREKYYDY